jgi:hypothetical protein
MMVKLTDVLDVMGKCTPWGIPPISVVKPEPRDPIFKTAIDGILDNVVAGARRRAFAFRVVTPDCITCNDDPKLCHYDTARIDTEPKCITCTDDPLQCKCEYD